MAANADQPFDQECCLMEWLNSLPPEAGLALMALSLIYWLSSLASKIDGLNSQVEELESRIDELEANQEDADIDEDDD